MRRNHISVHDLEEDLRLDGQMEDVSKSESRARRAQRRHQF